MRKRNDMYIDYERSYKRRRRRSKSNALTVIFIVILAVGLGTATYFGVKGQIKYAPDSPPITQAVTGPAAAVTVTPIITPTMIPTIQPTAAAEESEADTRIPVKVKGIYVTALTAGSGQMDKLISLADTTEVNTMVIDVKDDQGRISYAIDNAMAEEIGATSNTIHDMKGLLDKLKAENIYVIARIVAFKDPLLAEKHQEFAVRNKDGSIYRDSNNEAWVNPYKKEVWDYLVDIAKQAAAIGFEEIQFDYIRFSTGQGIAEADFGEAAKTTGKVDIITEFTKYAYDRIKPLGVFVSADVYGTIISSSIDADLVGQNYAEMSKYLDYICPMIYPSHFGEGNYGIQYPDQEPYNIIRKVLTASQTDLEQIPEGEHRAVVRPWLQAFTATWIAHYIDYGPEQIRDQIDGVYSVGYDEWILWNAANVYMEDGLLKE